MTFPMWLMEKQIADEDRRRQMGRSLSFISPPKNKAENRLAGSSPVRSFLQPLHRRTQNDARRGKSASTRCKYWAQLHLGALLQRNRRTTPKIHLSSPLLNSAFSQGLHCRT